MRRLLRAADAALDALVTVAVYIAPVMFPRSLDGPSEQRLRLAEEAERGDQDGYEITP